MAVKYGNGGDNTINGSNNDDFIYGKGGRDRLYGKGGNDYIDAGVGDDFLFGGAGDDILFGGRGDDTMDGGLGADQFKGGKGMDTVDYSSATSGVTAYLHLNLSNGYATGDTYEKMENVVGSAYHDTLQSAYGGLASGGAGNDYLVGGADYGSTDDGGKLRGDTGNDTLYMAYGNTRAWLQNGQGVDYLNNFDEGSDKLFIDLSEFGLGNTFDGNEIRNSNTVTAVGGNAQFIYEGDESRLWFDQNGDAAGGLTLVADFVFSSIDGNNLGTDDFEYQL